MYSKKPKQSEPRIERSGSRSRLKPSGSKPRIPKSRSSTRVTPVPRAHMKSVVSNSLQIARDHSRPMMNKINLFRSKLNPPAQYPRRFPTLSTVLRKRPLFDSESALGDYDCISVSQPQIYVHECTSSMTTGSIKMENRKFRADFVFGENSSNSEIYHTMGSGIVDGLIGGQSTTIFTFGATGSGKTYTIVDLQERLAGALFEAIAESPSSIIRNCRVIASYYEVDGDHLYDLLNNKNEVFANEDANGKMVMRGITYYECENVEDVIEALDIGSSFRRVSATNRNADSSRTHAIFELKMVTEDHQSRTQIYSYLNCCDLAGSERAADSLYHDQEQTRDAAKINKSLMSLKDCLRAVGESKPRIPVRGSKLTMMLSPCFLDNRHRSVVICCVGPSTLDCKHSISTLRFLSGVKNIAKQSATSTKNNPLKWTKPMVNRFVRETVKRCGGKRANDDLIEEVRRCFNMNGAMFARLTLDEFRRLTVDMEWVGELLYEKVYELKQNVRKNRARKTPEGQVRRKANVDTVFANKIHPIDVSGFPVVSVSSLTTNAMPVEVPTSVDAGRHAGMDIIFEWLGTKGLIELFKFEDKYLKDIALLSAVFSNTMVLVIPFSKIADFEEAVERMPYLHHQDFFYYSTVPLVNGQLPCGDQKAAEASLLLITQVEE
ncbi:hypothetical protein PCE1_000529 [Barthelona sp. PCE]